MDETTGIQAKRQLRSEVRTRRREAFAGAGGARARAEQAEAILTAAAPLLERIGALAAAASEVGEAAPLVTAYSPSADEADVMPLAREMAVRGARLAFPVASGGRELQWALWDGKSPFVPSPARGFGDEPDGPRLGVAALAEAALVLAPAVAVDRSGTRLGHGGGYYDRALRHLRPGSPVVVVVHPWELLEGGALPRHEHDVPVDAALTADGLMPFADGRLEHEVPTHEVPTHED